MSREYELWKSFLYRHLHIHRTHSQWTSFGRREELHVYLRVGWDKALAGKEVRAITVANVYCDPYKKGSWKRFIAKLEHYAVSVGINRIFIENVHNEKLRFGLIKNGYEQYTSLEPNLVKLLKSEQTYQ